MPDDKDQKIIELQNQGLLGAANIEELANQIKVMNTTMSNNFRHIQTYNHDLQIADSKITNLEAKLEKARENFDKYGQHFAECHLNQGIGVRGWTCTCGFEDAKREIKEGT